MTTKEKLDREKLPEHVAVIMDGNGRWARKKGAVRIFGHQNGVKPIHDVVEASGELGIKYLSLYAFSSENWGRPMEEISALMNLLVAIKGLPLTYNRDLQEDKPPLFDSIDTLKLTLAVNTEMIGAMEINEEVCTQAASDPMLLATDLADYLVKSGVPFRHAHELVGKAVAESIATKTPLDQIDLPALDEAFGADAKEVFSLDKALQARTNPGAPSIENVKGEIARWKKQLA